ncbi:transposase IS116/IS110/IS902 family protein [Bacteroides finegoldii]|uniref:Transposase IS116/IS110/IS902 family protein n=1 Tax=Bacteroides finegoldii TaxID=338188 RepID=A0A174CRI3_9BACE|nr:transposase IS116/IS110/IS902 family protein [Bacteroides finegoldii]
MTYVGIDVSKATFVAAYSSAKTSRTITFKISIEGYFCRNAL